MPRMKAASRSPPGPICRYGASSARSSAPYANGYFEADSSTKKSKGLIAVIAATRSTSTSKERTSFVKTSRAW